MIIINVLPPEYRRRDIGVNPVTLSIAGAVCANVAILLLWAYVQFVSIPHALDEKSRATVDRDHWKAEAEKVKKVEVEITQANNRFKKLANLLSQKVFWTQTINDFIVVLATDSRLNTAAFKVSIDSLSITEAKSVKARKTKKGKRSKAPTGRIFNFDWKARLVGLDREQLAEHKHTMYSVFEEPGFWGAQANSFMSRPDSKDVGYSIEVNQKINKSITTFAMKWQRFVILDDLKTFVLKEAKRRDAQERRSALLRSEGVN